MKIREYLKETTTSGSVDTYDVPYASGKGYHRTDVPPRRRKKRNCPKDKDGNFLVRIED